MNFVLFFVKLKLCGNDNVMLSLLIACFSRWCVMCIKNISWQISSCCLSKSEFLLGILL